MQPRIVGGMPSIPHGLTYLAALYEGTQIKCGATIISASFALTAAHCMSLNSAQYRLSVFRHNISVYADHECSQFLNLRDVICHPNYDPASNDNDICLLQLNSRILCESRIEFPVIHNGDDIESGTLAYTAGWGHLTANFDDEIYPDVAHVVSVPIISNTECSEILHQQFQPNTICAGAEGFDSCLGDSGGPLIIKSGSVDLLVGVVSWGYGCAIYPGVYSRTSYYRHWIEEIISMQSQQISPPPSPPPFTWHIDCECTRDGLSGNTNTTKIGCADHNSESLSWCYVQGGTKCSIAYTSQLYASAAWMICSDASYYYTICNDSCGRMNQLCEDMYQTCMFGADCTDCGTRYITYTNNATVTTPPPPPAAMDSPLDLPPVQTPPDLPPVQTPPLPNTKPSYPPPLDVAPKAGHQLQIISVVCTSLASAQITFSIYKKLRNLVGRSNQLRS